VSPFDRLPGKLTYDIPELKKFMMEKTDNGKAPINNFIVPYYSYNGFSPGSTDVGDVSWQTPTAQVYTACFTSGAPGHSWQNVSVGKTSIGHKGLIYAAKVLASTAVELFEDPELIASAKKEWSERAAEGYVCPIPENEYAKPVEV
jgi:aminobenzoyl-glutamate utilization protein B